VNLADHKTESGADFYKINVPTLVLDDGTVLAEFAAVLKYIADQVLFLYRLKLIRILIEQAIIVSRLYCS
jgi:glutathione S-transferase